MTKQLYPAPGRVILKVLIEDRNSIKEYVGSSSIKSASGSINVSRDFDKLVKNAKLDAVYQHSYKKGEKFTYDYNYNVQVIDFDIEYFDILVERKRVERFDGRTGKTGYWNEVRNRENGKLISRIKRRTAKFNEGDA